MIANTPNMVSTISRMEYGAGQLKFSSNPRNFHKNAANAENWKNIYTLTNLPDARVPSINVVYIITELPNIQTRPSRVLIVSFMLLVSVPEK